MPSRIGQTGENLLPSPVLELVGFGFPINSSQLGTVSYFQLKTNFFLFDVINDADVVKEC